MFWRKKEDETDRANRCADELDDYIDMMFADLLKCAPIDQAWTMSFANSLKTAGRTKIFKALKLIDEGTPT